MLAFRLLRELLHLDQFQGRSRFTTWAMAIAVRLAMSASLNFSLRHEVARLIVWHAFVTRPVVPLAVSYADVRLRRESSREECRKTSGIQVLDEPLELSSIDHSME